MSLEGSTKGTGRFVKDTLRDEYWKLQQEELRELIDPSSGGIKEWFSQPRPCPLCGGWDPCFLWRKDGFQFWLCNCGMCYVSPIVKEEVLFGSYREALSQQFWLKVLEKQKDLDAAKFKLGLRLIRQFCKGDRLLDVGCSTGHFLSIAKEQGYWCYGVELNQKAVIEARKISGVHILRGTLENFMLSGGVDIITFWDVLEHLPNPAHDIALAAGLLRKGGVVLAYTPNFKSLAARVLQKDCAMFSGRNHVNYFSKETLTRLFEQVGLQPVKVMTLISEANTVANYLSYEEPYHSNLIAPKWLRDLIKRHDLNYKILMIAKK